MLHSGLCSITFRKLTPAQIVDLVRQAKIEGIEWGGDIHVPHGDLARAREVRKMTLDAGIALPSYGSYYRVGLGEPAPFEAVLDSAMALGTSVIRVWAGKKGSAEADAATRQAVEKDSVRIAELAARAKVTVAYEYHPNTLTDTLASTLALLKLAAPAGMKTYWQPHSSGPLQQNLSELNAVLAHLSHVHCYWWQAQNRLPLAEGRADWAEYLKLASQAKGDRTVYVEFVKDDSPESFLADAAALRDWLRAS
jgi:3-dehydroshikimate dehydratase